MKKHDYLFPILLLLCFSQCKPSGDQYEQRQTHHQEITHDYDNNRVSEGTRINEDPLDFDHTENRDIWQQPQLVINLIGDLQGKTIADIGAGPYGYFSLRLAQIEEVEKVIAIDIEQKAIDRINIWARLLPLAAQKKLEPRLVSADNPNLQPGEVDIVLIVNTCMYFDDRLAYFQAIKSGLAPGGRLVIIDFKKKNTTIGPPVEERIALGQLERELLLSGYRNVKTEDKTLSYQYIITAERE